MLLIHFRKSFNCLIYLGWLALLTGPVTAAPAPITLDPKNTLIVKYIHNDNAAYAAGLLHTWLRKIYRTDTGFETINSNQLTGDAAKQKFIIALGPSPWGTYRTEAEVGPYGFAIRRVDNVLSIVGTSPGAGTSPLQLNDLVLGATYFLDPYCGVRLYLPDDLFASLPAKPRVTLPARINVVERPFTSYVSATGFANAGQLYEFQ